jgi:hypothetical protein
MGDQTKNAPDFFEENEIDPVSAATGRPPAARRGRQTKPAAIPKSKAGFYLSKTLLDRFNRKYYELKLAGVAVDNKSNLLELALSYALDDIDKGRHSEVLKKL